MASLHDNNINGKLADDMGLGKTIQTIAIFSYLWERKIARQTPHIVIAPKSTMSNWKLEFERWAPHFRVIHLKPTQGDREDILEEMYKGEFDVCITTY